MKPITQAAFARLIGVDRSYVTRLKQHGRIVITDAGLVEVEASRQKILETSGGRDDVAARWAAQRGAEESEATPPADRGGKGATRSNGGTTVVSETRAEAQARKEARAADLLEIELAEKRGNLIPKEDVDAALKAFAASMRAALEVFPDQTAPLVAPVSNLDEVHALLSEACRNVLAGVADQLGQAEAALKAEAVA